MTQEELTNLFKGNGNKWLDMNQIAKKLNINTSSVSRLLKKMRMWGEMEVRSKVNTKKRGKIKSQFRLKDEKENII